MNVDNDDTGSTSNRCRRVYSNPNSPISSCPYHRHCRNVNPPYPISNSHPDLIRQQNDPSSPSMPMPMPMPFGSPVHNTYHPTAPYPTSPTYTFHSPLTRTSSQYDRPSNAVPCYNSLNLYTNHLPQYPATSSSDPDGPPPSYESVIAQTDYPTSASPYRSRSPMFNQCMASYLRQQTNNNFPSAPNIQDLSISDDSVQIPRRISLYTPVDSPVSLRSFPTSPHSSNAPYPLSPRSPSIQSSHASQEFDRSSGSDVPTFTVNFEYGNPTVKPFPEFNVVADALIISEVLKDLKPDRNILIKILCNRSLEQRLLIGHEYRKNNDNLRKTLEKKLSGELKTVLVSLMTPLEFLNVNDIYKALRSHNYDVVADIICPMNNYQIKLLKLLFEKYIGISLETTIKRQTFGIFRSTLIKLCSYSRDETAEVNVAHAQYYARHLRMAKGNDAIGGSSYFIAIFTSHRFELIKMICDEYFNAFNETLEQKIKNEFSSHEKLPFLCIARYAYNKDAFYAKSLQKSMVGLGTNDNQLIRIIVSRSEIDLQDIKDEFEKLFKKSLKSWIKGDTHGFYRLALFTLIGEANQT